MRRDFPGLLKDKTAAGTLRWRVRAEGKPNSRILIPVGPGEPGFHEHYHAARAGDKVQVKKPQKAKAGTLDALCDGYLSWLEERIEDPDIKPKDKQSPLTLRGHRSLLTKACKVKDPEGDRMGSLDADLPEEAFVHIQDLFRWKIDSADNCIKGSEGCI